MHIQPHFVYWQSIIIPILCRKKKNKRRSKSRSRSRSSERDLRSSRRDRSQERREKKTGRSSSYRHQKLASSFNCLMSFSFFFATQMPAKNQRRRMLPAKRRPLLRCRTPFQHSGRWWELNRFPVSSRLLPLLYLQSAFRPSTIPRLSTSINTPIRYKNESFSGPARYCCVSV